jgi:Zinc knuckle
MDESANPAIMFEEFHRLSNIFNNPRNGLEISQYDFMAQVFSAAPPVCQLILNMESRIRADTLSLTHLETAMCQFWRTTVAKEGIKEKEPDSAKIVMANAPPWKKKFGKSKPRKDTTCYNCGKKGHFASKCWAPPSSNRFAPGLAKKLEKPMQKLARINGRPKQERKFSCVHSLQPISCLIQTCFLWIRVLQTIPLGVPLD